MKKYTQVGTDIESVRQKNADSGMSYNEVKQYLAKTTGGRGTAQYSNTNVEEVKQQLKSGPHTEEE
ncbi:gamma-type small acid-soluble spore protein [Mesobacillus maritimus]|uniref:gamma-type small acid-soluble spore protein n=1 Tax=Mesobacillus maritimus TaxID=1643336 RepID=UPI0020402A5B|nr:gamma-type small acid-soluble spore protein [Mesobacillus maritimus]MCM3585304.1 gamma-type small acid-soluble spore protein [Mesobacillus maritimus]